MAFACFIGMYWKLIHFAKNLDALHPNWIRTQSIIQMKIISEQGPNMPWKEYYGVLATGFILIYKENLNKTSRVCNMQP